MLFKGNTEGKTGEGDRKRKRRRRKSKEDATQRTTQAQTRTKATGKGEDKSAGIRETETQPENGKGMAGDVSGYQPTPEDLRFQEVYGDWLPANPGMHMDQGVRDEPVWQA